MSRFYSHEIRKIRNSHLASLNRLERAFSEVWPHYHNRQKISQKKCHAFIVKRSGDNVRTISQLNMRNFSAVSVIYSCTGQVFCMYILGIYYYYKPLSSINLRNGKRAACNHGVMDARGRLLSTKEA